MAVHFEKIPPYTLNVATGESTIPKKNQGQDDLTAQINDLIKQKVPLRKALLAIDKHPGITDKDAAKRLAKTLYTKGKPTKNTSPSEAKSSDQG